MAFFRKPPESRIAQARAEQLAIEEMMGSAMSSVADDIAQALGRAQNNLQAQSFNAMGENMYGAGGSFSGAITAQTAQRAPTRIEASSLRGANITIMPHGGYVVTALPGADSAFSSQNLAAMSTKRDLLAWLEANLPEDILESAPWPPLNPRPEFMAGPVSFARLMGTSWDTDQSATGRARFIPPKYEYLAGIWAEEDHARDAEAYARGGGKKMRQQMQRLSVRGAPGGYRTPRDSA